MANSRSTLGKPLGRDAVRHGPHLGPGLRRAAPQNLRDSSEFLARSEFVRLRMRFGSQMAAALELGVSRSSLENWERGAVRVPAWALVAIGELARETGT